MSTALSPITIVYRGQPVTVARERITGDMFVPNLGQDGVIDDLPGATAVSLFREADAEGALVIPDELAIDCYPRDDYHFNGFIIVIRPEPDAPFGLTSGWCDIESIARARGDYRADNDSIVVTEALEFIARKINVALGADCDMGA
ncbi:MAG: hypothetical protein ACHP93_04050 [Solirubrobacterales bacterium]